MDVRATSWAVALCLLAVAVPCDAATNVLHQYSNPPGLVTDQQSFPESATTVTTVTAAMNVSGQWFTHWTLNGARAEDHLGRGINPVSFVIYEDTDAVAQYVDADTDDGDGVRDWFEIHIYGTTTNAAATDSDGDGYSLSEEHVRDWPPLVPDALTDGGVSRRRSSLTTFMSTNLSVYTENSVPPGFVSRELIVTNGTSVDSSSVQCFSSGHVFVYWSVDGAIRTDHLGRGLNCVRTLVTSDVTATAHYLPVDEDDDGDGVPDWFELQFLQTNSGSPQANLDADAFTLRNEYRMDTHPMVYDEISDGGMSRRRSPMATYDGTNFIEYTINSVPPGFVSGGGHVTSGTEVATAALHGFDSGYVFAYWTVNGKHQTNELGMALAQASFTVTSTVTATAYFLPVDQDLDYDNVPDWYEWNTGGGTNCDASADWDGDGLDLQSEYWLDQCAALPDDVRDGNLSRRRSALALMNMQVFERVEHLQVDGVVTQAFSLFPPAVEGLDWGSDSAPGIGDWDADGDADLFVGSFGGLLQVYENTGSKYALDITERTSRFATMSAGWTGIPRPRPALGDWNGDGADDLAVGGDTNRIRIASSPGNFTDPQTPATEYDLDPGATALAVPAFGEFSGDDDLDLLVLTSDGAVNLYTNTGSAVLPFTSPASDTNLLGTTVPGACGITTADVDYDGNLDILVSDSDGRIWEFWGNGAGQFTLKSKVWAGSGDGFAKTLTIAAADLDGDADWDALCGYAEGGVMFLRDPKLAPPSSLEALAGASSVLLRWEPDRQSRVKGYNVYRASGLPGPYARINTQKLPASRYVDALPLPGSTNFYYVTALTSAYLPGSSIPRMVESRPSATVWAVPNSIRIWGSDYRARADATAVLKVSVDNAEGISGSNLVVRITYDPGILRPLSQVSPTNDTVELTTLSTNLTVSDNGAVADGELQITGTGGTMAGEGHIFDVYFHVTNSATQGTSTTNSFSSVYLA